MSAILLGFNSIAVEQKALLFLYMEKFKGLIRDHYEDLTKLQNKIDAIQKGSVDAFVLVKKLKMN